MRGPSKDWAPNDAEYDALKDATEDLRDRVVLYVLAEGGFRLTEFVSIRTYWLTNGDVRIPMKDPETGFQAKTPMAARLVPLKVMSRYAWDLLTDYCDRRGGIDFVASTAYRRVKRLGARAGVPEVFPHALRAYCATKWGHRLDLYPLMEIMGWDDIDVARRYIRKSGRKAKEAVRQWVLENRL